MLTVKVVLVRDTVEFVEDPQAVFVMVQRNEAGLVVTVTLVVEDEVVVMVAAPVTTVQAPVSPVAGALAAMVKVLVLHLDCATPALATVGIVLVKTTVALTAVHPVADTVQRSVAGEVVTVTAVVGEAGVVMVAAPETTVQTPVLLTGAGVAAMVKVALLHFD